MENLTKDQYYQIILSRVKDGSLWICDVPNLYLTKEICYAGVENNGEQIHFVPKKLTDDALIRLALERSPQSIAYIHESHKKFLTYNDYKNAVSEGYLSLKDVPKRLRDEKMCKQAVLKDGTNLKDVPKKMLTHQMVKDAIISNTVGVFKYKLIPSEFISEKLCLFAINQNPRVAGLIPSGYQNDYFYQNAVSQTAGAIYYVPFKFQNFKLYRLAVSIHPEDLQYVPIGLITFHMCIEAYQNAKDKNMILKFIPENIISNPEFKRIIKLNNTIKTQEKTNKLTLSIKKKDPVQKTDVIEEENELY